MTARRIVSSWCPAAIYTSGLERCVTTGGVIAEACNIEPLVSESLNDLDYGEWQWKTHDEVKERWPRLFERWLSAPHLVRFPGGESLQDVVLRSSDAFRTVVEAFPDDIVVLVGHDSVNRALLLQLLDQPLSAYWRMAQDPCAINVIEHKNGAIRVLAINDTSHIRWSENDEPPRALKAHNTDSKQ
jgi:phosphoserine phosphatase